MPLNPSKPIIPRTGSSAVTYDLSTPAQTTITLPRTSTWTSGFHWHETHDEYLRVIQGAIRVRLGNRTTILRAGELEVHVPKYVRHEWGRADVDSGEDVIVVERTEPADEEKHLFFWNLNGVVLDCAGGNGVLGEWVMMLRLFLIFWELDNWPVVLEMGLTSMHPVFLEVGKSNHSKP